MLQQDGKSRVEADTYANLKEHLNAKTVEELKKELNMMFEREESDGIEADPKVVLEYHEAIERKEQNKQTQYPGSFEESWATFTKNHPDLFPKEERKPRAPRFQLRHVIEAAVLVAILLAVSATATDWPDYFITFGKEILQISPKEPVSGIMELSEPNENGYTTLADAIADLDLPENAQIIDWVPARFSIQSITVKETAIYTMIVARFTSEDSELILRFSYYQNQEEMPDLACEDNNSDETQKIYKYRGINHLFTENFDRIQAMWKDENLLYNISGAVTRTEMERMVNSFYGG